MSSKKVRLQKFLAENGIASRRDAERLILEGRVEVNGRIVKVLGTKIDPNTDVVKVDDNLVEQKKKTYLILNKPKGYVTTMSDPKVREEDQVKNLLKSVKERVFPVGRLDKNTEGLLLFTNDGELANQVIHPSSKLPKTYIVKFKGNISNEKIQKLRDGVEIEDKKTAPAKVYILKKKRTFTVLKIRLHEGRKRQIRRMGISIGHPVLEIKRIGIGPLTLGRLKIGEYRYLRPSEISKLKKALQQYPTKRGPS
jgi:23S rRNA pseudouridine2605 synthase/16S rRNA pseudouridine516 synthase